MEEIAEDYVMKLIGRNLVMGAKMSSGGKIKACRIHDLLHDFCKVRANEENLLLRIVRDQKINRSSCFYCYHEQPAHRMSIYGEGHCIREWCWCWSHVGSIILHDDCLQSSTISRIFHSFRFLKVLDLEFTCIDSFPTDLVYLRSQLEISLPISGCRFTIENAVLDSSKKLYDLETLSSPHFSCVQDLEFILRKMPNLRKLRCGFKGTVDNFQYSKFDFPTRIETLKIYFVYAVPVKTIPFCISAPNLKNLTLFRGYLHPQHLPEIALLKKLQVLKLQSIHFDNMEWKVRDGEFPQLKVLKLIGLDHLREWMVADDAFPNLEHLVLLDCYFLKEIPSYFGEISSLKSIQVKDCDESVNIPSNISLVRRVIKMSSNQYQSSMHGLFERLQQLDDILYFPETCIDSFFRWDFKEFFRSEFQFLDIFLSLSFIDVPSMRDVTRKVQTLYQDFLVDFSELYLAEYFDFYTSKLQNKILLTKMEIKATYSFSKVSLPISADIGIPKFVTEFVHLVAENLPVLVKIDDPYSLLYYPETMERVKDVLKEIELLKFFACFVSERCIDPQSQHDHVTNFFTHVLAVASDAAMLTWLYLPDLAPEEINDLLSDFLRMRIKPIQPCIRKIYVDVLQSLKSTMLQSGWCPHIQNEHAEANFLETILHNLVELETNSNSSQIVASKDHLVILQEMLNLLKANTNRVSMQDLEFLQDIDNIIIDVGLLVYSFYNAEEDVKEVTAPGEVNPALVLQDLMGKIQHTSRVILLTIRKVFQYNLPRIHGLGYVDFLLNNLKEFQRRHSDSLDSIVNQLQIVQKELEFLQPFLEAVAEERHSDHNKVQRCATQLIGKAYEVEYIVDSYLSKGAPTWCLDRWLLDIGEDITNIREQVAETHEKRMVGNSMDTLTVHASPRIRMNEDIVGFGEVIQKLRDQLTKGTKGRDVISIVGMPGLGKTTMAYRLYSDSSVVCHFDIRAQCCVSQVYSRKNLLLALLRDVTGQDRENQDDELADELRRALLPKRYLILVDDVWEASAWDDLRGCFPDKDNGSRIILTTRSHEVANYTRFQCEPLSLRILSDDESWELLCKKVFGEDQSCSPLLTDIGKQIARRCGGLPLSVVLVAGILAEMEKNKECWEQVAENLGSYIHDDSRVIIEQSFQILPYHLKSCFLYFGAFPEDHVINVSKLIRLWISEGFIKSCESKSLEDIAEGYMENLIGRNLVMRTKKTSEGKIKACHIHDLLHDFCKKRAMEENFHRKWDPYNFTTYHRMSIYDEEYYTIEWSSHWSQVHSVIYHSNCSLYDNMSRFFHSFKFLKVLDLEKTCIVFFPTDLVYMRYFAAQVLELSILSSITNCWNLETLLINNIGGWGTLTIKVWEMVKLRNLHVGIFTIENDKGSVENSNKLHNLTTLSTPEFSSIQHAELFLSKIPNLRELKFRVHHIPENCVLNFPTQIKKLEIDRVDYSTDAWFDYNDLPVGIEFNYPYIPFLISAPNLTNLTLKHFGLEPRQLSEIGLFQNLQVLKLLRISLPKGWEVRNEDFPLLKVLKLKEVHFGVKPKWTVADEAFPNLERLVLIKMLHFCFEEIPSCFGDISSLKSIEVMNCQDSICKSARDIKEIQVEDYQNYGFEVSIIDERNILHSDDDEEEEEVVVEEEDLYVTGSTHIKNQ